MVPFAYGAAPNLKAAIKHVGLVRGAEFIAGGTDMLQLLQEGVRVPSELIDLNSLPLTGIDFQHAGLRVGALTRMAELADHPRVKLEYPVLAQALAAGASPQVRNMATIGGNLLQRTRCVYFRDVAVPCNKRQPGAGCSALESGSRMNAIFGGSESCVATYPGDLAVALVALEAQVHIEGMRGARTIRVDQLHCLPRDTPHIETVLEPGDVITEVFIPASGYARFSHYLKIRERTSFEFALTSAAVALEIKTTIRKARIAVGGVATRPWRLLKVEQALVGRLANIESFRAALHHVEEDAQPRDGNAFKVDLLKNTIERALEVVAGLP